MSLTLVLIRHGNTFNSGDIPRRVGRLTDLPLTESGQEQAEKLGLNLKKKELLPVRVYVSPLKRTQETAKIALKAAEHTCPMTQDDTLSELDHGPDENKTDEEITARLGGWALKNWDERAIMPEDWSPRPNELMISIEKFLNTLSVETGTYWAVTSNGVARFFANFAVWEGQRPDSLKISTGAYAVLSRDGKDWRITGWNLKPES